VRPEALVLVGATALFALGAAPTTMRASASTTGPTLGVAQYRYLSPVPGSQRVSPWNNIAIRLGGALDPATLNAGALTLVGSASGSQGGLRVLSDDGTTLIVLPERPFTLGETVAVRLDPGIRTMRGESLPALAFQFSVATSDSKARSAMRLEEIVGAPAAPSAQATIGHPPTAPGGGAAPCIGFLSQYPDPVVLASNDPGPGCLFVSPFALGKPDGHLLILGNDGQPLFYRYLEAANGALDFKRQPNGLLTYFQGNTSTFYALDSSYAVVDSFTTGNGYFTDLHDLQILPNGHALMMSYDPQPVDMSVVVPGGDPNATVVGLVLQELDIDKNVVFQWRSWDHFAIADATSPLATLTGATVDYVHGNAVELDQDGNWLLSSRHLSEITKIDRQTGEILWRLGLHALNNQFTFVGDERGFSHQHDIRRLPNGHITLFDNGNFLDPVYSRGLEYDLDEVNKVATLVWEHRNSPDVYSGFMGDAQRLENGGTLIGWGGTLANPKVTDVHADGSTALELGFEDAAHMVSYRAFRFPWRTNRFVTSVDSLDFGEVETGGAATRPVTIRNTSSADVTINCFVTTDSAFILPDAQIVTLGPGDGVVIQVTFQSADLGPHAGNLYVRQVRPGEIVARCVALRGVTTTTITAVGEPGPHDIRFDGGRPNPFGSSTAIGFALPRPEHVRLDILDVHGRSVATLADGIRPAGEQILRWAPRDLPNGVYFALLRAGEVARTRKLVHMR